MKRERFRRVPISNAVATHLERGSAHALDSPAQPFSIDAQFPSGSRASGELQPCDTSCLCPWRAACERSPAERDIRSATCSREDCLAGEGPRSDDRLRQSEAEARPT